MRLTLLSRSPGSLWIGPELTILTARALYEVGACWGWDRYDPLSLRPRLTRTPYEIGTVWAASWLGFTLSVAYAGIEGREEAARRVLNRSRLVEWK